MKRADGTKTLLPSWFNDVVTVASAIGLGFQMVKWVYKNRGIIKKLAIPAYFITLIAMFIFFPSSNNIQPFIIGRVTSVWGPSGPPTQNSSPTPNLLWIGLVWIGGLAVVTSWDLAGSFKRSKRVER